MKMTWKFFGGVCAASAMFLACPGPGPGPGNNGFPQPAGTVAVNFSVDDTANHRYTQGDLQWKGSFQYDSNSRILTHDSSWTGPYPTLYDDGPWTDGGHEPANATAGDHKWGVTVFVDTDAGQAYEYGLNDANACDGGSLVVGCNGWAWVGSNGSFNVTAGSQTPITAAGRAIPAFGTTDLEITLNTQALQHLPDGGFPWDAGVVSVKGSAWNWSELKLYDDGTHGDSTAHDGVYTFDLAAWAGAGNVFPHSGLANSGDHAEFTWVLSGVEYKIGGTCADGGVAGGTKASGASSFTPAPIQISSTDYNTFITVP